MRLRFVVVEKLAKVHGAFLALPVVSAIFISPHGDGRRGIVFGGVLVCWFVRPFVR